MSALIPTAIADLIAAGAPDCNLARAILNHRADHQERRTRALAEVLDNLVAAGVVYEWERTDGGYWSVTVNCHRSGVRMTTQPGNLGATEAFVAGVLLGLETNR